MEQEDIKKKLSQVEYAVTQENATERPFTGKYDNFYKKGIYVDIVSGEPLFHQAINTMRAAAGQLFLNH